VDLTELIKIGFETCSCSDGQINHSLDAEIISIRVAEYQRRDTSGNFNRVFGTTHRSRMP
jgi:hypothetical protein